MEKDKLLLDISSTASDCCELLKDLKLEIQSLIFQDASADRLNNIKRIVDEVESRSVRFQKMNVELNYVPNCLVEGMMWSELSENDRELLQELPRYKRYERCLSEMCGGLERRLTGSDLYRRMAGRNRSGRFIGLTTGGATVVTGPTRSNAPTDPPGGVATALSELSIPHVSTTVVSQTVHFSSMIARVDDVLICEMRFEGGDLTVAVVKSADESVKPPVMPAVDGETAQRTDASESRMRVFQEISIEAEMLICYLRSSVSNRLERGRSFLEWLASYHQLHSQPCAACGRILGRDVLPPTRRDYGDFSRALHNHC